ncbi:MAG: zinc ribbon domain-containing protein [Pseudobutyrivibrio sp.]|nr:zinc ribbon domain-containing protein [Pseudobutyrivibrio sp.]
MGFFDNLTDEFVNTTKDIGRMAQNGVDITKLQYDKKIKEQELLKLYEKLGRSYYEDHKEDDDESIKEISAVILRIKEISDNINSIKGGKSCPKCGALVKDSAKFCSACGEKINDIFED